MDAKSNPTDTAGRGIEVDDEIIGVLYAISVVSKRLARNLALLERQGERSKEGGRPHGQDERTQPSD